MSAKYIAIAAVAALSIAACGGATIETEPIGIEADEVTVEDTTPERESEPVADDTIVPASLGFDPAAIVAATDVCLDANDAALTATEGLTDIASVHYLYDVIAAEYGACASAMDDAGDTITDPELGGLWDVAILATEDVVWWTDYGFTGSEADLMGLLDRQDAVNDAWADLNAWTSRNL